MNHEILAGYLCKLNMSNDKMNHEPWKLRLLCFETQKKCRLDVLKRTLGYNPSLSQPRKSISVPFLGCRGSQWFPTRFTRYFIIPSPNIKRAQKNGLASLVSSICCLNKEIAALGEKKKKNVPVQEPDFEHFSWGWHALNHGQ